MISQDRPRERLVRLGPRALLDAELIELLIGTGASVLATANPGCHLQIARGLRQAGSPITLLQPVTLLARAYRAEKITESMTA